jgi:hypothetical protein
LSGHADLIVVEKHPLLQSGDDLVKQLVKVLVNLTLIVAKLFALLEEIFAEEVLSLLCDNFSSSCRV